MTSAFPSLLPPPSADLAQGLVGFDRILDRVFPLRPKHRATLPGTVRRLSSWLTIERDELPRDYMTRPETLSAYLRWFLPWNLLRQGRLLQGLELDLPAESRILDLGAGPATFLLALWLARPELRERPLEYVAVDRAEPALKAGRALFSALAGEAGSAAWRMHTRRSLSGPGRSSRADLLVAANFLNEQEPARRGQRGRGAVGKEGDDPAGGGGPEDRLLADWEKLVSPTGAVLLIEPGIRPSGRTLARIRQAALRRGWRAEAPCPHQEDCPLPGVGGGSWCHFTFATEGAPPWLHRLAREVRLPKERVSLSFLLLARPDAGIRIKKPPRPQESEGLVRVVSEPFDLPTWKIGRYGCSERGLVLLEDKKGGAGPQSADAVRVRWPEKPRKDAKSGALVVPRAGVADSPCRPAAGGRRSGPQGRR